MKTPKNLQTFFIISAVVLLGAIAGWYYVNTKEAPQSEPVFVKEVHLSSSSVKKLSKTVHPLVYHLLFGKNLEVEHAESLPVSGAERSLVTFRTSDDPGSVRAEYTDYFAKTGWTLGSSKTDPDGGYLMTAGRLPENVTVRISPRDGGSSVNVSYLPPPSKKSQ